MKVIPIATAGGVTRSFTVDATPIGDPAPLLRTSTLLLVLIFVLTSKSTP